MLAAYGRLDNFDAAQLGVLFAALPAISPHPAWLDELVQICAAESSALLKSRSMDMLQLEEDGFGEDREGSYTGGADELETMAGGQQLRSTGLWSMANGGTGPVLRF